MLPPQPSHHQTPANEASQEHDLQAELVELGPVRLPIRHQQEGVGHDADQGESDEGKPYEAGTLSCAHGEAIGKNRQ